MTGDVIAVVLGLLVGASLGALGGGGSTLAVPILVFVAGLSAQDATSASLLVVGIASAVGVIGHYRAGNVRLGAGVAFGAAGIVGSRIGLFVNRAISETALLLAFSALIAFVALRMYRSVDDAAGGEQSAARRDGAEVASGDGDARSGRRVDLSAVAIARLLAAATAVGMLTGLFGVGGGFAVVPALTLVLGFPAKEAIGTSLVVIVINALIALGLRAGDLGFDWSVVGPFLVTVTIGVLIGTRVAERTEADRLTRAFAVLLGAVAVYTATSTLLGA